jgi:hypothetical protein
MNSERRRSPRYPFFASVEITEPQTGVHLIGRTSELSLHGCYFDMMNPLPSGSIVKVQILNHEQTFEAKGHVIYSQSNMGMGVVFDEVEADHQQTLEKWLAKLEGTQKP